MELEPGKPLTYASRKSGRNVRLAIALASTFVGVGIYTAPSPAYAIYCANCSTFYQQMFEYAEQVNTALNTAEQLQPQIQQYQNMVTQGTGLPNSIFGSIAADLKSVINIYQRSRFAFIAAFMFVTLVEANQSEIARRLQIERQAVSKAIRSIPDCFRIPKA